MISPTGPSSLPIIDHSKINHSKIIIARPIIMACCFVDLDSYFTLIFLVPLDLVQKSCLHNNFNYF